MVLVSCCSKKEEEKRKPNTTDTKRVRKLQERIKKQARINLALNTGSSLKELGNVSEGIVDLVEEGTCMSCWDSI